MNVFFRNLFPTLFDYLGESCPKVLTMRAEDDAIGEPLDSVKWPYQLVTAYCSRLSPLETIKYPTALVYQEKSSTSQSTRAWKEKVIHLGMSPLIPLC